MSDYSLQKLGSVLIFLQFLDGLFTYIGVTSFGVQAEGNPIIKYLIETFGIHVGLVGVKLLACTIIVFIIKQGHSLITARILKLLIFLYANVVTLWIYGLLKNLDAIILTLK